MMIDIAIWIIYGFMFLCWLGMMEAVYCMWQEVLGKKWNGKRWAYPTDDTGGKHGS